jgi:hypothetical protein
VYEDLTQHYKAVARRLAAVPTVKVQPVNVQPVKVQPARVKVVEAEPKVIKLGVPPVSDDARHFISSVLVAHRMVWRELIQPDRRPEMVRIRAEIYEFLSNRGWSLPQIGNLFKRDHTTVLHSLRKLPEWRAK